MRLNLHRKHKEEKEELAVDINQAEKTEIIINPKELTAYHQTFMSSIDHCEYKGKRYSEPIGDTQHYNIGFWNWGRKLAMHFSQHTTQAKFFDWFHFAANVSYPVGYLHVEGNPEPLELKVNNPDNFVDPTTERDLDIKDHLEEYTTLEENAAIDWSKINYAVSQNRTIEEMHEDVDYLLSGEHRVNFNLMLLLVVIIVAIAACIVGGAYFLGGNHSETVHQISNITATVNPTIPTIGVR